VRELMKYVDVDSPGKCLNNRKITDLGIPINETDSQFVVKARLSSKYKFTIAMENSLDKDYRTEKLFVPLLAGSVPIIFGKPNSQDFLPTLEANQSAILVEDFKTMKSLAEYIKYLDKNEHAYRKYFDWKTGNINKSFGKLLQWAGNTQTCRMCQYLANIPKDYFD
jgi:galactoside 3-L-fucosyltransferase 11